MKTIEATPVHFHLHDAMQFSESDLAAKRIALHYANSIDNHKVKAIINGDMSVESRTEAELLTCFYWAMVEQAVDDQEHDISIGGVRDLQFWMERIRDIFSGYLQSVNMGRVWLSLTDAILSR